MEMLITFRASLKGYWKEGSKEPKGLVDPIFGLLFNYNTAWNWIFPDRSNRFATKLLMIQSWKMDTMRWGFHKEDSSCKYKCS